MAVVGGLSNSSISRLKDTQAHISNETNKVNVPSTCSPSARDDDASDEQSQKVKFLVLCLLCPRCEQPNSTAVPVTPTQWLCKTEGLRREAETIVAVALLWQQKKKQISENLQAHLMKYSFLGQACCFWLLSSENLMQCLFFKCLLWVRNSLPLSNPQFILKISASGCCQ